MSKVKDEAVRAKSLLENPDFQFLCAEIEEEARVLFMNANSDINEWTAANQMLRAIETFKSICTVKMNAAKMEAAKEARDRGND